jgi:hypothetical protein
MARTSFTGATIWLSREERRELARGRQHGTQDGGGADFQHRGVSSDLEYHFDTPGGRLCLYCRGPLANGRAVCSDACNQGWWQVVPTIDGELWT